MSDSIRQPTPPAADTLSGVERDARVEQLLLQGLDSYFAGDYETAVHIWTRVLFLDRGHARARAYIERARSAQAERQRESEELLHRGVAAFDRGDTGDARELLTAAVSQGVSPDVALSYLGRLDRLEPVRPVTDVTEPPQPAVRPAAPDDRNTRPGWLRAVVMALVMVAGGAAALGAAAMLFEWSDVRVAFRIPRPTAPPVTHSIVQDALPVPRQAEIALARARTQFASGRPAEALRAIAGISPSDPLRPDADRLRAEIQRTLLAAAPIPAPAPDTAASRIP